MISSVTRARVSLRGRRCIPLIAALAVGAPLMGVVPPAPAASARPADAGLDIGRAGLRETRSVQRVTTGVSVTTIVRGQKAATNATRGTTPLGPWRIRVATIDKNAKGQLRTAIGTDIARTEGVSTLARWSRSYVAVNGSFFSQGRRSAPGDMVGLAVNAGTIISQPQRVAGHMGVLMDSRTKRLRMDDYTWKATLTSEAGELFLDAVNTPLVAPPGCEKLTDFTRCPAKGQVVRHTPHYSLQTSTGPGAEVVFDRSGCVVSAKRTRGTRITPAQTTVQATGASATELLRVAGSGCPAYREKLFGADREPVTLSKTTFGVVGRYRLVRDGRIVAPTYKTSFFQRQPRTIIGRTAGGSIKLVTIDGRSTASVGATMQETARVAKSLGLVDAVNLDGGGSTAMAVRGRVINTPAGGRERSVGDAVVFMP